MADLPDQLVDDITEKLMAILPLSWPEREKIDAGVELAQVVRPYLEELARDVCALAYLGGMPDSFWGTDTRIARARVVLGEGEIDRFKHEGPAYEQVLPREGQGGSG